MKVAALTSGHNVPSTRFRLRQYLPLMREAGIDITEYCPILSQVARLPGALGRIRLRYLPPVIVGQMLANIAMRVPGSIASHSADVTWLERNFIAGFDDGAVILKKPIVLDIDDAIWLYSPFGLNQFKRLVRRAEIVFAGNQFLANWCSDYCSNIKIIPTAVDSTRFVPRLYPKPEGSPFVIGWTGTSGNFKFLEKIEDAIGYFLKENLNAKLLIVADRIPSLPAIPSNQIEFVRWQPSIENTILHEMDVGIMPLDDSDLSKGKCSFKLLQYMAVGIPIIASPFGMNLELLNAAKIGAGAKNRDDWIDALVYFSKNKHIRLNFGANGRELLKNKYSTNVVAKKISENLLANFT